MNLSLLADVRLKGPEMTVRNDRFGTIIAVPNGAGSGLYTVSCPTLGLSKHQERIHNKHTHLGRMAVRMTLLVHILGGGLGLVLGAVAFSTFA